MNITCEKTGYNAEIEFKLKVIIAFFVLENKDCCIKQGFIQAVLMSYMRHLKLNLSKKV